MADKADLSEACSLSLTLDPLLAACRANVGTSSTWLRSTFYFLKQDDLNFEKGGVWLAERQTIFNIVTDNEVNTTNKQL